jgi:hypothetical protein
MKKDGFESRNRLVELELLVNEPASTLPSLGIVNMDILYSIFETRLLHEVRVRVRVSVTIRNTAQYRP